MAYNLRPRVAVNEIKSKVAVVPSSFGMVLRSSVATSSKAEKKTVKVQKETAEIHECAKALVSLSHGYFLRSK